MSVEQQDAMNHSSFEDEEAQIQAVFKEAIRLKRRNKDLVEVNRNNESYLTHKLKELEDIVRGKNQFIDRMQVSFETLIPPHYTL